MTRTDRLRALIHQLEADTWQPAAALGTALGVSERTIYRDVQALLDAGVPVLSKPGAGYRLDAAFFLEPLLLSAREAGALLQAAEALATLPDPAWRAHLQAASRKLRQAWPGSQPLPSHWPPGTRFVPLPIPPETNDAALLTALRRALTEQRAVQLVLAGGSAPQTFHLYALVPRSGSWRLIGYEPETGAVRALALDGIATATVLDERFDRPAGYRTRHAEAAAWPASLDAEILFDAEAAAHVLAAPAFEVIATDERAEGVLITFRAASDEAFVAWLLSWGPSAFVASPPALRRRVRAAAQRIADQYQPSAALLV